MGIWRDLIGTVNTVFKIGLNKASLDAGALTAPRIYALPDKPGTVAMTVDITGTNSGTNTGDQINISGNAATATTASGLTSSTTTVVVSASIAPISGHVLTASSSTAAAWAAPASGVTRSVLNISLATTAGAASGTDYAYFVTGTTTLTLPTAVGNTNRYTIKSISGVTAVACAGIETIDGTATIGIAVSDSVDLISNGTEWKVI